VPATSAAVRFRDESMVGGRKMLGSGPFSSRRNSCSANAPNRKVIHRTASRIRLTGSLAIILLNKKSSLFALAHGAQKWRSSRKVVYLTMPPDPNLVKNVVTYVSPPFQRESNLFKRAGGLDAKRSRSRDPSRCAPRTVAVQHRGLGVTPPAER
jgi:hypothetical protein